MTEEIKQSPVKKRRTSLQRQRKALLIVACLMVVLAVAFGIVYYFTSQVVFVDDDGTEYFINQRDLPVILYTGEESILEDQYVLEDANGNMMPRDEGTNNFYTKLGTIVNVDATTGDYVVVAKVLVEGGETTEFDASTMNYDVLLYPYMDSKLIDSIFVTNEKGSFTFLKDEEGNFYIDGHKGLNTINGVMLNTLVNLTGYTTTMARINFANAFDKNAADYDSYEGFRQNGYAEYGLPENMDDATTYFIIKGKDASGNTVEHKVAIGNPILSGTGYYIRYAGRDEVYVLREMETTESHTTLSATLLGATEDYVTPMVTVPISTNNYFDMENFTLSKFDPATGEYVEVIGFTYEPIQLREGKFAANYPYKLVMKSENLSGYMVNSYRVDDCLQHIQSIVPLRTVKLYSEYPTEADPDVSLRKFLEEYCHEANCKREEQGSCACAKTALYAIEFNFISDRDDDTQEPIAGATYLQQVWVSPMNKNGNYYLFNAEFNMVVECTQEYLEFLEWERFEWIEPEVFSGNIAYIEKVEIQVSGGIGTIGGANKVVLNFDNSLSEKPSADNNYQINSDKLVITADYADKVGVKVDVYQFRLFYQTLLISSLEGTMPAGSEESQESMIASGDSGASLVIKMTYNADGEQLVRVYRFYSRTNGNLGAFTTLNGTGNFYMIQRRVDKIISDAAKLFTPADMIDPEAKY